MQMRLLRFCQAPWTHGPIIAWAVATPFAEEYDAPWLYDVASPTVCPPTRRIY